MPKRLYYDTSIPGIRGSIFSIPSWTHEPTQMAVTAASNPSFRDALHIAPTDNNPGSCLIRTLLRNYSRDYVVRNGLPEAIEAVDREPA